MIKIVILNTFLITSAEIIVSKHQFTSSSPSIRNSCCFLCGRKFIQDI